MIAIVSMLGNDEEEDDLDNISDSIYTYMDIYVYYNRYIYICICTSKDRERDTDGA